MHGDPHGVELCVAMLIGAPTGSRRQGSRLSLALGTLPIHRLQGAVYRYAPQTPEPLRCERPQPPARCGLYRRLIRWSWHAPLPYLRCEADGSTHQIRGDYAWQRVALMCTTIITQWVFLVALANLGRDRPCKQPKGQALFFLVDHGHPEMLAALGAEEVRDILKGTMLEAFVGI